MQENNKTQNVHRKESTEEIMDNTTEQNPVPQQTSIRDTLGYVFGRVFERGQRELTKVAHESKERLLLRSLRKDRIKLYEKIGREVEQLILTGDIEHPGLEKRITKIREIEQEIEDVEIRIANQHIQDEKNNET